MAAAVACIDAWAARELAAESLLVAAERQDVTDRTASHRWYLRFKGDEKDFITVWLTLRQRCDAVRSVTSWRSAATRPKMPSGASSRATQRSISSTARPTSSAPERSTRGTTHPGQPHSTRRPRTSSPKRPRSWRAAVRHV